MSLQSSLARHVGASPMTDSEKDERARQAWRAGCDLVALRLSVITDDWIRQAIINELTRQFGTRPKQRGAQ
jgi:hypothetical protein